MALTLHAKVDSRGEASLPLGEHDEQAEANTQTIHGGVQSRNREAGEAKRSIDGGPRDGVGDQREVDWGLQAWSVYIVVDLSLAYFSFRRGLPLTVRSAATHADYFFRVMIPRPEATYCTETDWYTPRVRNVTVTIWAFIFFQYQPCFPSKAASNVPLEACFVAFS